MNPKIKELLEELISCSQCCEGSEYDRESRTLIYQIETEMIKDRKSNEVGPLPKT